MQTICVKSFHSIIASLFISTLLGYYELSEEQHYSFIYVQCM